MVTHFTKQTGEVACGRNNHNVNSTSDEAHVTCKTCQRIAAAATEVQPSVSVATKSPSLRALRAQQVEIKRQVKNLVHRAWCARLAQLTGRNRLPRRRGQQLFV